MQNTSTTPAPQAPQSSGVRHKSLLTLDPTMLLRMSPDDRNKYCVGFLKNKREDEKRREQQALAIATMCAHFPVPPPVAKSDITLLRRFVIFLGLE